MAALLALVLGQASAAERAEALARELDPSDVRRAYRAVERLAGLGEAALPAIEAAAARGGPAKTYFELAAREIRLPREVREASPAARRYSIKSSGKTAAQLLIDLERQSGAKFHMDDLLQEEALPELEVEVSDATFLEALDAICRAGNLSLGFESAAVEVSRDGYSAVPKCFYGSYLARLESYARTRVVDFRKPPEDVLGLDVVLVWEPAVRPCRASGRFTLREAVDDRGKSLVPPPGRRTPQDEEPVWLDGNATWGALQLLTLSPGATKIALLRGEAVLAFAKRKEVFVLDKPRPGAKARAGGFEVTLKGLESQDTFTHMAEIEIASPALKPEAVRKLPVDIDLYAKGGRRMRGYVYVPPEGEGSGLIVEFFDSVRGVIEVPEARKAPELEKIEVSLILETAERPVPFEFRDLKLK